MQTITVKLYLQNFVIKQADIGHISPWSNALTFALKQVKRKRNESRLKAQAETTTRPLTSVHQA